MGVAVIVDWFGPYKSFEDFKAAAKEFKRDNKLLYMATRKHNGINYIGLTRRPKTRFNNHPSMSDPTNTNFFIGEVVSQGVSGRRGTKTPSDLRLAEIALVNYTQSKLNKDLRNLKPTDCVVVYSRFFAIDWETPANPLPKFPGIIAYNYWTGEYV